MKKAVLFLLVAALASVCRAELVDDFDGYDISASTNVIDLDTSWESRESSDLVDILDDGTGNQVLAFGNNGFQNAAIPEIADTSTATTMFYRFYVNDENVDNSFGLSDMNGNGWFDNFEIQIAVIKSGTLDDGLVSFRVRSGGGLGAANVSINVGQWYNVWVVVDQTTDTYDVYLGQGTLAATAANIVADDYSFRNGTSDPLIAIKGLGYNSADHCIYLDDMYIIDGLYMGYAPIKPYDPEVSLVSAGGKVEATLSWKPSVDETGTYAVEPDITEEYLFLGDAIDNLLYVRTVADPGTDPITISEIVTDLDFDKTYYWTVVDALSGFEAVLDGASTVSDADPNNNIVGPTWSFDSLISSAVINSQPSDTRAFVSDPATFVVDFYTAINPVVAADWYKNGAKLTAGSGITMDFTATAGDGQATLTIDSADMTDEGSYYCVLSTDASTIDDDVQTATRILVIKKLLAEYTFDNAADPLENTGEIAAATAAQMKTVTLADPNEMKALVIAPSTGAGIVGSALYLASDDVKGEYVDLGTDSYPQAGPLDTIGDIRGVGYEKQGFGRGMDEGTILCWVKLESDGCVIANASNIDGTHFAVTTDGARNARIIVRGNNWDSGWQNLGEANGAYSYMTDFSINPAEGDEAQWHMFAATWSGQTARIFINGEQVATNTQGFTEVYTAWDFANLIGVSRQGQPNRHLLNANDFITGAIDELRIYNYEISSDVIANEYALTNELGVTPCMNQSFAGNIANIDNTVASYCVVDLYDLAALAANWLSDGFEVEDVE